MSFNYTRLLPPDRYERTLAVVVFLLLCTAFSHSHAQDFQPFTATYQIAVPNQIMAEMSIATKQDGQRIHYHSKITPSGIIGHLAGLSGQSHSEISVQPTVFIPLRYQKDGVNQSKQEIYQFNWQTLEASITRKGEHYQLALSPGVIDENTLQLQLRLDVMQSAEASFDKSYQILSDGKLKTRRFTKTAEEYIGIPLGRFEAIRIERQKDGVVDQIYWLSPAHDYLPAQIEKLKDGKTTTRITLLSLE